MAHFLFSAGKVTLMEPLDYEKISSYTLLIQALDQGTPQLLTTHKITVDVIDVYDFIPACEVTEKSINSSIRVGTLVATVDAGRGNLRYSLIGNYFNFIHLNAFFSQNVLCVYILEASYCNILNKLRYN